jgi:long-subunit acyl-CoA synthetase (AMP-forming)
MRRARFGAVWLAGVALFTCSQHSRCSRPQLFDAAGTVGWPLPGVDVRIAGEVQESEAATVGELRVKGPGVFSRYWGRLDATSASFDTEGYFCTGDIVQRDKKVSVSV